MRAGLKRRFVTIERAVQTPNGSGGFTESWEVIGRVFASAVPVGGTERLTAGTLTTAQGWRVTMLHRDVTTKDRLQMDGQQLTIISAADPDGKRRDIVLLCEFQPS
jgi:SPP1 family predicted phage head-tail adaptor